MSEQYPQHLFRPQTFSLPPLHPAASSSERPFRFNNSDPLHTALAYFFLQQVTIKMDSVKQKLREGRVASVNPIANEATTVLPEVTGTGSNNTVMQNPKVMMPVTTIEKEAKTVLPEVTGTGSNNAVMHHPKVMMPVNTIAKEAETVIPRFGGFGVKNGVIQNLKARMPVPGHGEVLMPMRLWERPQYWERYSHQYHHNVGDDGKIPWIVVDALELKIEYDGRRDAKDMYEWVQRNVGQEDADSWAEGAKKRAAEPEPKPEWLNDDEATFDFDECVTRSQQLRNALSLWHDYNKPNFLETAVSGVDNAMESKIDNDEVGQWDRMYESIRDSHGEEAADEWAQSVELYPESEPEWMNDEGVTFDLKTSAIRSQQLRDAFRLGLIQVQLPGKRRWENDSEANRHQSRTEKHCAMPCGIGYHTTGSNAWKQPADEHSKANEHQGRIEKWCAMLCNLEDVTTGPTSWRQGVDEHSKANEHQGRTEEDCARLCIVFGDLTTYPTPLKQAVEAGLIQG